MGSVVLPKNRFFSYKNRAIFDTRGRFCVVFAQYVSAADQMSSGDLCMAHEALGAQTRLTTKLKQDRHATELKCHRLAEDLGDEQARHAGTKAVWLSCNPNPNLRPNLRPCYNPNPNLRRRRLGLGL